MSLKPCGTTAAYRRHKQAGETPCEDCHAVYSARPSATARYGGL